MAGISGISSGLSNAVSSLGQVGGSKSAGGASNNLGVNLKDLLSMLQQLEGGVSKKAAPTHAAW